MKKHIYISKCIELIEDKLHWGSSADWIDYNFSELSEQIFTVSKVSISIRTLKRIFKSATSTDVYYEPQIATKNALAQFLNYNDWSHFIADNFESNEIRAHDSEVGPANKRNVFSTLSFQPKIWIWVGACLLVIVSVYSLSIKKSKFAFVTNNLIGPAPHNAAFSYDLSDINYKNAIIDFDCAGQFKPLISNKGELTFPYKTPNYYKVKLIVDGQILSSKNIDVVSDGWVSYVGNDDANAQVIHDKKLFTKNGALYFSPEEMKKINIDTNRAYWVDFRNIMNYHLDGDNLILELKLKNSKAIGGFDCFDTCIEYIGETGKGRYKFVRPGCTQYADTEFGDTQLTGNFHNLSSLGINLSNWTTIRIEVKNRNALVYVNKVLKYKTTYNTPIGNVHGFFCRFKGSGALDYFRIYNLHNKLVYHDEFNSGGN